MTKPTPESVAALERELAAARAAQAATAEILAAMNASPGDPQPVFEAVAHHARLLAGAVGAVATRLDGDTLHLVAWSAARGYKQRAKKTFANFPRPLDESALNARAIVHRAPAQVPDLKKAKGFDRKLKQAILEGGAHSLLAIPILHGEDALGSLMVVRTEPGAFDDELVGLLQGFAGQAAQALVNARLIRETRELLERQTATGEVLAAIGSSVADTAPVFEKILDGIEALIPGGIPAVLLIDEHEQIDLAACRGMPEAVARAPFPCPVSGTPTALAIAEQRVLHYPDVAAVAPSQMRSRVKAIGNHAIALAPMIFEGRGIGSIGVVRVPPRPFSDKELALLKTFSDQAAIAVENARLFNDTREALEYQTATADVLRVLGNSMTDSQPVFETILSSAQKLLDANDVGIVLLKADGTARIVAACSDRPDERSVPQSPPDPNSRTVQLIRACEVWHVPDAAAASDLTAVQREQLERYGNHSGLLVPLVWEDRGVGAIAALRFPVRPFSNKEIRLLQTFADQAVIAIENAHLFRETNEALERQTATAEVLETISNSIDDTAPVFERILDSCERLVSADQLSVLLFEDGLIHLAHTRGPLTARASELYPYPVQDSPWADGFTGERVLYVPDSAALDPAPAIMKKVRALIGDASFVSALMVRGNQVIGLINAMRQPPRPFAEKEIGLLRTFADQAVIAIENARLFREINEALEQQTATADVLKVIGTSVEDAAPVFEAILDSCRHLFSTHQIGLFMVNERDEIYLPAIHGEASAGVASAYPMPVADSLFNVPATSLGIEYFPSIAAIEDKARDSEIILEAIGDHSLLVAPMVRGSRAIGFIGVANLPPRSFSDKERSLLQTFADQAVIAIQNARMFRETNEALEQQTATAGILKVIGNSVADTAPVFEEILTRSEHLFSSEEIGIFILREDGLLDIAGYRGSAAAAVRGANPRPLAGTATERAMAAGHALYYPDVEAEPDLPEGVRVMADLIGNFSIVIAPLMWEGRGIGSIVAVHTPPRPFSTKDI
ncbi:MAG: GAF domain-containing protein, partial [Gammaproteobacteria bacterium]|nr:GAF domain-containing protein [Gammaproteobacteria bacterium]